MWKLAALVTPLFLVSCSSSTHTQTEILWDTWGIPHIFAADTNSLFHAYGYAQAANHGNLILRLYGQARGRGAQYWGQQYLDTDRTVHRMGIPSLAQRWVDSQSEEYKKAVEAFAAGINAYVQENPSQIEAELKAVLPIQAVDVLAHILRVIHFTFVANPGRVSGVAAAWSQNGSNTWAIGPSRSANGHALLLANPHLPWSDLYLFHEAHLNAPGLNAYGATLIGFPVLAIAFNDNLGWSHTVNTHDGADFYELILEGEGYRWDGAVRPFETENQVLKVRKADGSYDKVELIVKRSVHGPVVAEQPGRALALRVAGLDQPGLVEQYMQMLRAQNLAEFESALSRLQMPMFTVMFADKDGHIMHLFGGRTPIRSTGDWAFWQRPVPGENPSTLWTKTHPYKDLPRVVDPQSGWLQNANDPPWTTTSPEPLDPAKFPPYMAPQSMNFRAQRSARMLDEDKSITLEEMIAYKHSTRMEMADRILETLINAAKTAGTPAAKKGAEILAKWDRCADAESRGAVLFDAFVREWFGRARGAEPFAVKWEAEHARSTPSGLASPREAVVALASAVAAVEKEYGSADVPWGQVNRLKVRDADLPANGGPGLLGIFRVVDFRNHAAMAGDSYVAAIEFSQPVRAQALMSYGNSSQPGSAHATDQLPLFAKKQLRPVWRTRAEIEAHLESRKVF